MSLIAFCYAFFQFAMPMVGWVCVHTIVEKVQKFQKFVPWIALLLLLYVGGKMIVEFIVDKVKAIPDRVRNDGVDQVRNDVGEKMVSMNSTTTDSCSTTTKKLTFGALLVQGVATSIDALSVGFTISEATVAQALVECAIIAVVTFGICIGGLEIGKKVGSKLADKAGLVGGIILVGIGIEIFVRGVY